MAFATSSCPTWSTEQRRALSEFSDGASGAWRVPEGYADETIVWVVERALGVNGLRWVDKDRSPEFTFFLNGDRVTGKITKKRGLVIAGLNTLVMRIARVYKDPSHDPFIVHVPVFPTGASVESHSTDEGPAEAVPQPPTWRSYLDPHVNRVWWYCEATNESFWHPPPPKTSGLLTTLDVPENDGEWL